jgi:hypothetical protein
MYYVLPTSLKMCIVSGRIRDGIWQLTNLLRILCWFLTAASAHSEGYGPGQRVGPMLDSSTTLDPLTLVSSTPGLTI